MIELAIAVYGMAAWITGLSIGRGIRKAIDKKAEKKSLDDEFTCTQGYQNRFITPSNPKIYFPDFLKEKDPLEEALSNIRAQINYNLSNNSSLLPLNDDFSLKIHIFFYILFI